MDLRIPNSKVPVNPSVYFQLST